MSEFHFSQVETTGVVGVGLGGGSTAPNASALFKRFRRPRPRQQQTRGSNTRPLTDRRQGKVAQKKKQELIF